jgi:hypothetical protein
MKTYKIAHAKKLANGWDLDFSSYGEFFTELNEAQQESDLKNKKLMQSYADGNGIDLQEFIDSGRANEIEEYYHVIEVAE